MAAPLHDHRPLSTSDPVARFFALEPAIPVEAERPALRVIPGGREAALRHRQPPEVYLARRRAVALVVAGLLLVVLLGAGALVRAATAPGDATGASSPEPTAVVAGSVGQPDLPASYVVQPGDSLWSIAEELDPRGDIRPLVDELARRAGPGVLEAGTRLELEGLGG
jgi:hypothetical protein